MSLQLQAAQLRAMTVYELRMHWRRRGLLILMLGLAVMIAATMLILGGRSASGAQAEQAKTFAAVFATWAPAGMALAFILPVMLADTIPLDHQQGVKELLNSLPLPTPLYLIGKVSGACAAAGLGVGAVLTLAGLGWWIRLGAYDLGRYLEMCLVGAGGLIVLNGGLAVLATAGISTRRRAILVTAIVPFVFFGAAFATGTVWPYISPIRGLLIMYFFSSPSAELYTSPVQVAFQDVLLTIIVGLAELFLAWLLAWGWLRWRENR